jgi:hypothetical protein
MTRDTLLAIVPAAVILAGALFADQAAAFSGPTGNFPPDAMSSLLVPQKPAVTQGVTVPAPLPGN